MASSDAATANEIRAAVQKIEKAFADQDVVTIERMYAPDHISIAARYGGALRMPEQLETIVRLKRTTFDVSLLDVKLLSTDAALVTYEESYSGTYEGETLPPRVFISQIWLKQDGAWRQSFYQETPIAQP